MTRQIEGIDRDMRYNIKCDECGKTFLAESQTFGKVKYRCPYCGKILTCKIDSMTGKRVKARLVVPVTERSQTFDKNGKPLPLVPVVVEKSAVVAPKTPAVFTSDGAAKTEGKQSDKPQGSFFKRLWRGLLWFLRHSKACFYWSFGYGADEYSAAALPERYVYDGCVVHKRTGTGIYVAAYG